MRTVETVARQGSSEVPLPGSLPVLGLAHGSECCSPVRNMLLLSWHLLADFTAWFSLTTCIPSFCSQEQ